MLREQLACRVQKRPIINWSDIYPTGYHRAITWMELVPLYNLCGLRESFCQCRSGNTMETFTILWNSREASYHHKVQLWRIYLPRVPRGLLSDPSKVKTGVRQGCFLSPFLFLLAIDWIMKSVTDTGNNGIQWTPWEELDDLDYADSLALLLTTTHKCSKRHQGWQNNQQKLSYG